MKDKETYRTRAIDRMVFGILAALLIVSGVYIVGPWYLEVNSSSPSPLVAVLNSIVAIKIYGVMLLCDGFLLAYLSRAKDTSWGYVTLLTHALFAAFIFRLYSFIAVIMSLESLLPLNYISHGITALIPGAYWVYVKLVTRREGTTQ